MANVVFDPLNTARFCNDVNIRSTLHTPPLMLDPVMSCPGALAHTWLGYKKVNTVAVQPSHV